MYKFSFQNYDNLFDKEERKKQRKEEYQKRAAAERIEREEEINSIEYPFPHLVTEAIRRSVAEIEYMRRKKEEYLKKNPRGKWDPSNISPDYQRRVLPSKHSQAVYILDADLNILDWVIAKHDIGGWLRSESTFKKGFGRTLIYHYLKERKLYKDTYYFVPVKDYEDFMAS